MRGSLLFVALMCTGCESMEEEDPCDRMPALDYANWGRGFMSKHCTACHSKLVSEDHRNEAPEEVDLDTFANVLHFSSRIEARVLHAPEDDLMPPGGGPTEDEKRLLNEWLICSVLPTSEEE
jgi:uncharacterized membrane protein